jgi:formylglycine-generating enzyme required for sulfatase activity
MKQNFTSPFKFLDSYSIEDKDIFFGRDSESKEIYRKFFSSNLLLLYGKSGTGKSSLINCGLMANIPDEDVQLIKVRCGDNPFRNLINELNKISTINSSNEITLIENIFENNFKPLAFVFDQFEEVFILANEKQRKQFITALKKLIAYTNIKKNIVLVIREEYLANLTEIENEIPKIFDNRIRLQSIKKGKYKEIIEKPCIKKGVKIEKGLSANIIDRISKDVGDIELTYFQVLMDNLYRKALLHNPNAPILSNKDFNELGSIDNILGDFLNFELTKIKDISRVEAILKVMVTSEGTKKPISLKEITKQTSISEDKSYPIIRELIDKRIIREKNDKGQYELMHDSLAKRIFDKMSEEEKKASEIKQLLINRYNDFKNTKTYLDKETLEYIQPYLKHIILKKNIIYFIKKSQNKIYDKGNNKLFYLIVIIFIPIVIVGYFLILNNTNKNKEIASLNNQVKSIIKAKNNKMLEKMATEYIKIKGGYLYFRALPNDTFVDSSMVIHISDFEMCKHEVTVEEYRLYCTENHKPMPIKPKWGWSDNYPIVNVNWNDANNYCAWLSRRTGDKYRLPTEAEFEFAAKGGIKSKNYTFSGSNYPQDVAVYNSSQPSIIEGRKANELGIYDLSGNVREWCSDWFSENINLQDYDRNNYTGPLEPSDMRKLKVARGGAYSSGEKMVKVNSRYYGRIDAVKDEDGNGLQHFGFRCIKVNK